MPKPVVHAQLHDGFFVQGMGNKGGQFDKSLPPTNKTLTNFTMELQDNGTLYCKWEDGIYSKGFTIAAANVKYAQHPPVLTKSLVVDEKKTISDKKNS